MKQYIAYCGLDCESCEARSATVNDDDSLRQKVAKEWSELNGVEISPEMINCVGCEKLGAIVGNNPDALKHLRTGE